MPPEIAAYHAKLTPPDQAICDLLYQEINTHLTAATEHKVWHAHPVWFINGNPIVGYSKRKVGISLMFWSGQSFEEPGLANEGSFKAAEVKYTELEQVNVEDLRRWLEKGAKIQWNYRDIVKNRGKMELL